MDDLVALGRAVERDLNNGFPMTCEKGRIIQQMADRIEELEAKLATCEKYRDAYAECDRIGTQAVRDLEETAEELADKLAQAVWRLEQMRDDHIAYRHVSHFRRGAAVTLSALEENK